MSLFEMCVWAVLWLLVAIEVAGIGYMMLSGRTDTESDFDVAEADLEALRKESSRG